MTLLSITTIVFDCLAANEYLTGRYYPTNENRTTADVSCRPYECESLAQLSCHVDKFFKREKKFECYVKDPIYGYMTVTLMFLPGVFWSSLIFFQLWCHLHSTSQFQRKRMFFVFFPLGLLSMATFPLQLVIIRFLYCFNDKKQWTILTLKVCIAEGLFNCFEWLLESYIFLSEAGRQPSTIQLMAAFGSLLILSYSRVESLMLDRGVYHQQYSLGQTIWWHIRHGPFYLLNCSFKLCSISLIITTCKCNCIWLYGFIMMIWSIIQACFNEGCLPRKYYYYFIGTGIHATSTAHIQTEIKQIDTKQNPINNILWLTNLSNRKVRRNNIFQNMIWFIFNTITLSVILIVSRTTDQLELQMFWPFTPQHRYYFARENVASLLNIIIPIMLALGLIIQIWLLYEERKGWNQNGKNEEVEEYKEMKHPPPYRGWIHDQSKCPGCSSNESHWHRFIVDQTQFHHTQGKVYQMFYPLINLWENFVDKNLR